MYAPNQPPGISKRGTKSLAHALDIITKPVFSKRGFAENRIITDWNKIVGDVIGTSSLPRKLTFTRDKKIDGTLYIEVSNSGLATEMVYLEPMILEKISCYFGYKAVCRIKIIQNLKAQILHTKPAAKKKIPENKLVDLELSIAGIDDEDIRKSLRSLGEAVLAESLDS